MPHPFDRMHSVPDYEHLVPVLDDVDAIEVFNPRVAISSFNDEAARFAAKYRDHRGRGLRLARRRRASAPCASGCATSTGPQEFLQSLREADILTRPASLLYVQALKFLQTRARRLRRAAPSRPASCGGSGARTAAAGREPASAARRAAQSRTSAGPSKTSEPMPVTDDQIREKYLERAIRELNSLTRELQGCTALSARQPDAGARLGPPAGRHHAAQALRAAFGGRGGRRVLRARGRRDDEVPQAPVDRPARGLRNALRKCPLGDSSLADCGVHLARARRDRDRPAAR